MTPTITCLPALNDQVTCVEAPSAGGGAKFMAVVWDGAQAVPQMQKPGQRPAGPTLKIAWQAAEHWQGILPGQSPDIALTIQKEGVTTFVPAQAAVANITLSDTADDGAKNDSTTEVFEVEPSSSLQMTPQPEEARQWHGVARPVANEREAEGIIPSATGVDDDKPVLNQPMAVALSIASGQAPAPAEPPMSPVRGQRGDSLMPLYHAPHTVYRPAPPVAQQAHDDISSPKPNSAARSVTKVEAVGGSSTLAAPVPSAPKNLDGSHERPRGNTTKNSLPQAHGAAALTAVNSMTATRRNAGEPPDVGLRTRRLTDSQHVIAPAPAPQTALIASQEGAQIIAAAATSGSALNPLHEAQKHRPAPEAIALPSGLAPMRSETKISTPEASPLPQPEDEIATPAPLPPQARMTADAGSPATTEAQITGPAFSDAKQSEDLPLDAQLSPSAELIAPAFPRESAPQVVNTAQTTQHHRSISNQLGEVILRERNGDVEVTLTPEDLGSVRLSIRPGDSGHIITIWAERPETLEAARRAADLLQRDLRESGFGEAELSFSGGRQDNRSSPSQRAGISGDSPVQTVTPPATKQVSQNSGRLNIKV